MIPTLFLVHGFAASKLQWIYQIEELGQAGYITRPMDLLGHGDGTRPRAVDEYTLENMFLDFSKNLDDLGINPSAVLIGHSLGAYLSIKYALQYPEKIKGIVLVSPLICTEQMIARSASSMVYPRIGSIVLKLAPLWAIRLFIARDKLSTGGLPQKLVDQVALDYKRADPNIVYLGNTIHDILNDLPGIKCPSLMIWGGKDNTLTPEYYSRILLEAPKIKDVCIPDGGHTIHLTHPKEVNQAIREFLQMI